MIYEIVKETDQYDLAGGSVLFDEIVRNTDEGLTMEIELEGASAQIEIYSARTVLSGEYESWVDENGDPVSKTTVGGKAFLTLTDVPNNSTMKFGITVPAGTTGTVKMYSVNCV